MAIHLSGSLALTGSITVGTSQTNTGTFSTIAGGKSNTVSGNCSFIGAGQANQIVGGYAALPGGCCNCAFGNFSFIGAGCLNSNCGVSSTITAGCGNCIETTANCSFIGGGSNNRISSADTHSSIVGGFSNSTTFPFSFVAGGQKNQANNQHVFIGGGCHNTGSSEYNIVVGGTLNKASGVRAIIVGGYLNCTTDVDSIIVGGVLNCASGEKSSIINGVQNTVSGGCSILGGGQLNTNAGNFSFIGGGCYNELLSSCSSIVGGYNNCISGSGIGNIIGNGASSQIRGNGSYNFIGVGYGNRITTTVNDGDSAVVGGQSNCIENTTRGFIGSGFSNCITNADYSGILGGNDNTVSHANSFIVGSNLTSNKACYTFMNNLDVEGTVSASIALLETNTTAFPLTISTPADNDTGLHIKNSVTDLYMWLDSGGGIGDDAFVITQGGINRTNDATIILKNNHDVHVPNGALSASIFSGSFVGDGSGLTGISGGGGGGDYSPFLTSSNGSGIYPATGSHCTILGNFATIAGGNSNTASACRNFIGGGCSNTINTTAAVSSFIGSGEENIIGNAYGFIGAGRCNVISSTSDGAFIGGGQENCAGYAESVIVGGCCNCTYGAQSFIGAGNNNNVGTQTGFCAANWSAIVGGSYNTILGTIGSRSFIGAGNFNCISASNAGIVTGQQNSISGSYTFIGGGRSNNIGSLSTGSAILGGRNNTVNHHDSFIIGSCLTTTAKCTTYMNNTVITGSLTVGQTGSLNSTVGRIDATNDIVGFSTSDRRLKENIQPIENALSKVIGVSGNIFDWRPLTEEEVKTIHGNKGRDVGVIAQEIEEILPEAVTTRDSGYKAVNYEKIVPLLIEAIKEQQKQIDELKSRL